MSHPAFSQLLTCLPENPDANLLIVLDENCDTADIPQLCAHLKRYPRGTCISNRFDVAQSCMTQGANCRFSDLDFSDIPTESLDAVLFRVAKEKAVTHHVINQAFRSLRAGGCLHLSGEKQEGIKSYIQNTSRLFGDGASAKKNGNVYSATLRKGSTSDKPTAEQSILDDRDYSLLRPISPQGDAPVYSKPGIFGWNKVDQGSALLARHLSDFLEPFGETVSILDLGCGYGYLALEAHQTFIKLGRAVNLVATDNNAAALVACQKNFATRPIAGEVIASDCGEQVAGKFDVVMSHPPFHKGFKTQSALSRRFVQSAFDHLKPGGKALLVANSFVPLDKLAEEIFGNVSVLEDNRQFRVIAMKRSR